MKHEITTRYFGLQRDSSFLDEQHVVSLVEIRRNGMRGQILINKTKKLTKLRALKMAR